MKQGSMYKGGHKFEGIRSVIHYSKGITRSVRTATGRTVA